LCGDCLEITDERTVEIEHLEAKIDRLEKEIAIYKSTRDKPCSNCVANEPATYCDKCVTMMLRGVEKATKYAYENPREGKK